VFPGLGASAFYPHCTLTRIVVRTPRGDLLCVGALGGLWPSCALRRAPPARADGQRRRNTCVHGAGDAWCAATKQGVRGARGVRQEGARVRSVERVGACVCVLVYMCDAVRVTLESLSCSVFRTTHHSPCYLDGHPPRATYAVADRSTFGRWACVSSRFLVATCPSIRCRWWHSTHPLRDSFKCVCR